MNLRKIIRELKRAGLTQGAIARAIRVRQATVSRYESGEIKCCDFVIGSALMELHRTHVPPSCRRPALARRGQVSPR